MNSEEMKWCKLVPELTVANLEHSLRFYVDTLGFKICYARENPKFAYLEFEGSQIMLEEYHEDGWNVAELKPPFGRGVNFQIECSNTEALKAQIIMNGCRLYRDTKDSWYNVNGVLIGSREFLIQDPDGYLLRFAQDLGVKLE
jgi:catechol 2,3-dioxygenase-like lactoylglutathione lyase family enzyme